ncbi:MAG TPA: M20/M25/M40 family metallo-hydrolase [Candidatus Wallbacteria bacterium]|nr:M20/M25/M40 family metallo-hydrolase [Candidatus Wallbacteria bacterium]
MFGAHYDTLPYAPRDPDPKKQQTPIDGANDGASGVAVLLELARVVSQKKDALDSGVKLVFFDGEDFYTGIENMFYGSKYFAASLKPEDKAAVKYFILVDMVGDSDLGIYKDHNSQSAYPDFTNYVFSSAKELGFKNINDTAKYEIADDHIAMIGAGITSTLLIDFDYPAWHTTADTVGMVSAESLEQTGKLLEYLVFN